MNGTTAAAPGDRATSLGVLLGLIAGFALFYGAAIEVRDFKPDEVGLGANTINAYAEEVDGHVPSGHLPFLPDAIAAARDYRSAGNEVALWLGNSQLHGLNRPEAGGAIAVVHAQRAATARGARLRYVQISSPMIAYYDMLAMYLGFRHAGVLPDYLLVQVTYGNFRDTMTRHGLNLETLSAIDYDELREIGGPGIDRLEKQVRAVRVALREAEPETPQQRLEAWLIGGLESFSSAYRERGKISAQSLVMWQSILARATGDLFQRSGVVIDPEKERESQTAIDALVAVARHDGVQVILYRAPHRPGGEKFFYDRAGYDAKFAELAARGRGGEYHFLDLEKLVSPGHWGRTNEGRPDCFHFDGSGHKLLGDAIDAYLAGLEG